METTYDTQHPYEGKELYACLGAMSPRQLRPLLQQACRREGKKVKAIVIQKAAGTGLRHGAEVGRSVRVRIYPPRYGIGFMLTAKSHNGGRNSKGSTAKGFHKNSRGLWKPVALWASGGTEDRYTGMRHFRGRMPVYPFMDTAEQPAVSLVEQDMNKEIIDAVARRLDKNGIVTS